MFKTPPTLSRAGAAVLDFGHSSFEFVSDFKIRISNLNMPARRAEPTLDEPDPLIRLIPIALLALTPLASSGCMFMRWLQPAGNPSPVLFEEAPTLETLIAAINQRSDRVYGLQSTDATLSAAGIPSLSAEIAWRRPRNFRLRAGSVLTGGAELDLGSNDELLWIWSRRNQPPATYYCRHNQFAHSAAGRFLPVEPAWLAEAMGIVRFEPTDRHELQSLGNGEITITSAMNRSSGLRYRRVVMDERHGLITHISVFDQNWQALAVANMRRHTYYAEAGVTLPRQIEVQAPPADLNFTVNVGDYLVNQLPADSGGMFQLPQLAGYPLVDLADPRLGRDAALGAPR